MKLSRLYSNQSHVFEPIAFNEGFSVILAEIRLPENRDVDIHNLGKSTLASLIDFCLLKGKNRKKGFLFKNERIFKDFTFYLELKLLDGTFLTIARPVVPGTRVDLKRSESSIADAAKLLPEEWDHLDLAFETAKLLLDGILAFQALKPWDYRQLVGYLIRSQRDYLDVFQLAKFAGKHGEWKPFMAHLLGMDSESVIGLYDKNEELTKSTEKLNILVHEWGSEVANPSSLDGLISVKRREVETKNGLLGSFDFSEEDQQVTKDLVEKLETRLSSLTEESYRLSQLISMLMESLEVDKVNFRTEDAERLFEEAGVIFGAQIKKEYSQLLAFNRAISKERRDALKKQLGTAQRRAGEIVEELRVLNSQRAHSLSYLRESQSLAKYKQATVKLVALQAELQILEAKRDASARLIDLRREERTLKEQFIDLQGIVESQIVSIGQDENGQFGLLRRYFTEIIFEVLGQNANLSISLNSSGGLDFTAEYIGELGTATDGDEGTTYKKLLCIAFDLAMLRAHMNVPFARFVYHDGALEQLESRKKKNLLEVLRRYSELGIQAIISVLDSDVDLDFDSSTQALSPQEIVLTLHDEGESGRLFKMPSW